MMRTILPGRRSGSVRVPASKSMAHRYLMAAALFSGGRTAVAVPGGLSDDLRATQACLEALAAARAADAPAVPTAMPCGESGTTLRFFLPIVGACGVSAVFERRGRLAARPLAPFDDVLRAHGMMLRSDGDRLYASGQLRGGAFRLPGNVSSQFFSGLLFAFELLDEPASFEVEGPLESASYVEMTRRVIAAFRAGEPPPSVTVEGDWSNAAFFLAMGVEVTGLDPASAQGDRAIVSQLAAIRGSAANPSGEAVDLDVAQTPDAVPALAAAAAITSGAHVRLVRAARLRLKESDRLASTTALLTALGGSVRELEDGLEIWGRGPLAGGRAEACGDHRIAMAAAVAATGATAPVLLDGAECVSKSYPRFWDDFDALQRHAD